MRSFDSLNFEEPPGGAASRNASIIDSDGVGARFSVGRWRLVAFARLATHVRTFGL